MKVKVKGLIEKNEVISYFENIINGLKEGQVVIQQGEDRVSLESRDYMKLEISAEEKKDKSKIFIEISSKKIEEKAKKDEMTISSTVAEAPAETIGLQ